MSDSGRDLNKNNMDILLADFANEVHMIDPNTTYNIYIVGGGALVLYYNLRDTSRDIDASFIGNNAVINKVITDVANKYKIDKAWLNNDYEKSESFSRGVIYSSILYRSIFNINFYIVKPELALCMKIIAFRGRTGKKDRQDAKNIINLLRSNGVVVNPEVIIDWLETYYNPVPELRSAALSFIYNECW